MPIRTAAPTRKGASTSTGWAEQMRPGGNGTAAAAPGREETPIEAAKRGRNDTLVDLAYRCIRRDIIEEVLPAGEKINLSLLCQRYGVSPTPIKQALNRLMMERPVEGFPGRGTGSVGYTGGRSTSSLSCG